MSPSLGDIFSVSVPEIQGQMFVKIQSIKFSYVMFMRYDTRPFIPLEEVPDWIYRVYGESQLITL